MLNTRGGYFMMVEVSKFALYHNYGVVLDFDMTVGDSICTYVVSTYCNITKGFIDLVTYAMRVQPTTTPPPPPPPFTTLVYVISSPIHTIVHREVN